MTELQLRQKVVDTIKAWVGSAKGSAAHKEILQLYNTYPHDKATVRYTVTPTDDYCDTTVSAAYIKAGVAKFTGTECGVERHTLIAKAMGIWVENDAYKPKIGDSCVYDWQDNGVGDATGWADHIGIVVKVNGNYFDVAEGNMSGGKVGIRTLQVNARYIRGFITPDFAAAARSLSAANVPDAIDITIQNAVDDIKMDSPDYWEAVLRGKRTATPANIKALMDKYHAELTKKK